MTARRPWAKALRILRNTGLVLLALLVIGTVWYVLDVRIAEHPLEEGEQAVVPERTLDAEGRWRVGPNWLGRDTFGLYEVYIEGDALERGLAYGSLARELVEKQEQIFTDRLRALVPGEKKLNMLKYFVAWFDRDIDEHVPMEYQREIFGVSRSFSDSFDFVGPKFHRALNYHASHDIGHALQDLALVGCTSFSAWGDRTLDGSALVARNFDFYLGEEFAHDKLITFINPTDGIPHALVSWGGFMGATSAMNLEGLTVTINASRSSVPFSARMPISLLARSIVEHARTLDEAIAIAKEHEVFVSESILIHSANDKRAIIIEKAPDGMDVYTPTDDLAVCANHYQSPYFLQSEVNAANIRDSDSQARYLRMQELLQATDTLDPQRAVHILRDQHGPGGADIGMGNPMAINQLIAHHAVVFQPDQRLMWVSAWPYQMGAFVCYDLRKVFVRCAANTVKGPVFEPDRTIAADPFIGSQAMRDHDLYTSVRNNIQDHVISGRPMKLSYDEEIAFLHSNPECYLTYVALGDLHKAQKRFASAALYYQRALEKTVASADERARIQRSLAACAKN